MEGQTCHVPLLHQGAHRRCFGPNPNAEARSAPSDARMEESLCLAGWCLCTRCHQAQPSGAQMAVPHSWDEALYTSLNHPATGMSVYRRSLSATISAASTGTKRAF